MKVRPASHLYLYAIIFFSLLTIASYLYLAELVNRPAAPSQALPYAVKNIL